MNPLPGSTMLWTAFNGYNPRHGDELDSADDEMQKAKVRAARPCPCIFFLG